MLIHSRYIPHICPIHLRGRPDRLDTVLLHPGIALATVEEECRAPEPVDGAGRLVLRCQL